MERLILYDQDAAVVNVMQDKRLDFFLLINDIDVDLSILPNSPVAEILAPDKGSYIDLNGRTCKGWTLPNQEVIYTGMIGDEQIPIGDEFRKFLWGYRKTFGLPGDPPGEVKGYLYVARLKHLRGNRFADLDQP